MYENNIKIITIDPVVFKYALAESKYFLQDHETYYYITDNIYRTHYMSTRLLYNV